MSLPPTIEGDFITRPDGRGGYIISRPPVRVVYPCSKCGHNRFEKVNNAKTQIHVLPCGSCEPEAHFAMIEQIESGTI